MRKALALRLSIRTIHLQRLALVAVASISGVGCELSHVTEEPGADAGPEHSTSPWSLSFASGTGAPVVRLILEGTSPANDDAWPAADDPWLLHLTSLAFDRSIERAGASVLARGSLEIGPDVVLTVHAEENDASDWRGGAIVNFAAVDVCYTSAGASSVEFLVSCASTVSSHNSGGGAQSDADGQRCQVGVTQSEQFGTSILDVPSFSLTVAAGATGRACLPHDFRMVIGINSNSPLVPPNNGHGVVDGTVTIRATPR